MQRSEEPARRLWEVFGEVLPDTTSDEREAPEPDSEDWHRDNRPPHHDRPD